MLILENLVRLPRKIVSFFNDWCNLALLGMAKYFTSLDLRSWYRQVVKDGADQENTAFTCHRGLFEYNVMPFDLSNASTGFQELMSVDGGCKSALAPRWFTLLTVLGQWSR